MATVHVSIGRPGGRSTNATTLVFVGLVRSEDITSSGTAASGALTARTGDVAQIHCDTAVRVATGSVASATNGLYIPAGVVGWIGMNAGDVISVIDA